MAANIKRVKHKMNCLVTGGAGFIGSNLVDKLIEDGNTVVCIDNESAECHDQFYWNDNAINYKLDICKYDDMEKIFNNIDYVFHVASDARIQPAILNPKKSIENNILGTLNMLELSRKNNVKRFIYSSTSSAYGKKSSIPNIEYQPSDPLTPYSTAKVFGENLCRVYYNLYGVQTLSFRYFNVYGNRQPLKGQYAPVIGLFQKQLKNNQPLTIVGNGEQRRDFTHVSDIVEANIAALSMEDGFGEVYNIGYGKNYSIIEIANMLSDNITFIPPRIGEVDQTLSSTEKFRSKTSWTPKISLDQWIKDDRNSLC
jgi:UDP-glucose 4-epimerase